jgi:hypothetical protein
MADDGRPVVEIEKTDEFFADVARLAARYPFSASEVATALHRLNNDAERTARLLDLAQSLAVLPNQLLDVARR